MAFAPSAGSVSAASVVSDADGLAQVTWTLGTVAGYLVAVFLLYIAAGIAKAVIGAGVGLMNPDYKKVLGELKAELRKGRASK